MVATDIKSVNVGTCRKEVKFEIPSRGEDDNFGSGNGIIGVSRSGLKWKHEREGGGSSEVESGCTKGLSSSLSGTMKKWREEGGYVGCVTIGRFGAELYPYPG